MKVAVFSSKSYDRRFLEAENLLWRHELTFLEANLDGDTATLAKGFEAVCVFVNDCLDAVVLDAIHKGGVRYVLLRCAGFNNVDLAAAASLGLKVARVPAYSPYAVAEHAVALIMTLNRKTHRAHNRIREGNFSLEGLLGFDLRGRVVGVVGTGKIGAIFAKIMLGFGCEVLACDLCPSLDCEQAGVRYVELMELFSRSDIVSLHSPLTPQTRHLIGPHAIEQMKPGVMIINTSRGALIDTRSLIKGLKDGKVGYVGLDVYEEEADLFFEDLSGEVIQDDVFARLTTFPNVLITGHQAFLTENALQNIARTTMENLAALQAGRPCPNLVGSDLRRA